MHRAHSTQHTNTHIPNKHTRTSGIVADREALAASHEMRVLRVHALQLSDELLVGALFDVAAAAVGVKRRSPTNYTRDEQMAKKKCETSDDEID
jgi:hypothetical protein